MKEVNMLTCPFCEETDFDDIGLKIHLLRGWCDVFNAVISPEEECHLIQIPTDEEVNPPIKIIGAATHIPRSTRHLP